MLDQFLKLLERFVVAHELIAANGARRTELPKAITAPYGKDADRGDEETATIETTKEIPVEGEDVIETKPAEEEKPKRKPRKAKAEETVTPEQVDEMIDYQSLRNQIQAIDDAINEGPSDAACDDSDELLEEFTGKKMKIAAIKDEDLAEYLERLTAIKNKYFEEE